MTSPIGGASPGETARHHLARGPRTRWMSVAVAATFLNVLAPAAYGEEAAVDAAARFGHALESGDRVAVLDCLAPEVVIFEHGGAELSREEYVSHHLDGDLAYLASIDVRVVDRKVLGGADRAIVLTRTESSGQFDGKPVASRGTETLVLERRGERWLIVHIHWSSGRSS